MNLEVAAASFIQAERILRLETPLGPDVLLPERFELHEAVSDLFLIQMSVRSMRTDLKPEELVGKMVDVSVETGEGARRTWNGLVVRLSEGPLVTRGLRAYHLTIRPKLWLMSQRSDCRIWLDKTSVEVAQILCSEHGLEAPKTQGIVTPPKPQHYSVQFNETDLAYLTRRLEEDGIFYWFEHEGGQMGSVAARHTLVLANHEFGYAKSETSNVRFAMGSSDRNHISKFEKSFSYVPGKRSMADWNFLEPNGVPQADTPSLVKLPGNDQYDLYEYPAIGGYGSDSASEGIDRDRVEAQSKLRMQAAEAEHNRVEGQSSVRTLAPGFRFTPYDVSDAGNQFEEHVVIQIVHVARDRSYETNEGDPEYVNRFLAIPSRVPATPHRTVSRPRVEGTQIAIIAGPEGEEIHTDPHGRVKVWFPWDRRAKKDGSDTCWIRVAQNWGGAGWGGQIIPRIGMEAVLSHIDGDFDKPLIVGLVPNARQKTPYKLPENKTRSVFKTNTHKSKDVKKFNELRFEDKEGREEIYIHAQKDMSIKVNHNVAKHIGGSVSEKIQGDDNKLVGLTKSTRVVKDYNITVGFPEAALGMANFFNFGDDNLQRFVPSFQMLSGLYKGTTGDFRVSSSGNIALQTSAAFMSTSNGPMIVQSGGSISILTGGAVDLNSHEATTISSHDCINISSSNFIKFQCGDAYIVINSDGGIRIHGTYIEIESSTDVNANAKDNFSITSQRIDLNK